MGVPAAGHDAWRGSGKAAAGCFDSGYLLLKQLADPGRDTAHTPGYTIDEPRGPRLLNELHRKSQRKALRIRGLLGGALFRLRCGGTRASEGAPPRGSIRHGLQCLRISTESGGPRAA